MKTHVTRGARDIVWPDLRSENPLVERLSFILKVTPEKWQNIRNIQCQGAAKSGSGREIWLSDQKDCKWDDPRMMRWEDS